MKSSATDDRDAPWRACYRELGPKLLLFARQWVPSHADAEDVVQTAFVKFWNRHPAAPPADYPLLYAAVRSTALDHLRQTQRRGRREQAAAPGVDEPWFDGTSADAQEMAETIEAALRRLPPEQREVLILHVWSGLTFAETAAILKTSPNTVASRHRYALEALRKFLKPTSYERV